MEHNDLLGILLDMRGGQVAADCNAKFNECLQAVLETGGKGELTIKLLISPSKFAMGGAVVEVETEHEAKMKKPELKVGKAIFFVSKDGKLSREPQDQTSMFTVGEEPKKEKK